MVELIQAIEPPCMGSNDFDKCTWGGTSSGYFTISNAFDRITGTIYAGNIKPWKHFWKLMVPEESEASSE